jgi:O-6-methylguanine DNA methyltransferase
MNKETQQHEIDNQQDEDQNILRLIGTPDPALLRASRRKLNQWFERTAPVILWDTFDSPLGRVYIAITEHGLSNVEIGMSQAEFLSRLDPMARTERSSSAVAPFIRQFREYFNHARSGFEMRLDFRHTTPFQQRVLETIRAIPAGTVWTYGQVAKAIGAPAASRAVGHALGTNPLLIVVPCHRVIGNDGTLRGYKAGLETKQKLLRLEGAPV